MVPYSFRPTQNQCQKNSHLYIPERFKPLSIHSPTFCSPIQLPKRPYLWWTTTLLASNQDPNDFKAILSRFFTRLLDRGHDPCTLTPIFLQGAEKKDHQTRTTTNNTDKKVLYVHWPYHPNGIHRQDICHIYNDTLQPLLNFDLMQIAVSRPKNLRDVLTKSNLTLTYNMGINTLIQNAKNEKQKSNDQNVTHP